MRKLYEIWQWIRPLVLVAAVMLPFRSVIADWNDVPTGSMNPTIVEGDRIFVNKLAYGLRIPFTSVHLNHWARPQRGDIVVCYAPDSGTRLVKRVIGLPGDVLRMQDGVLEINGQTMRYSATSFIGGDGAEHPPRRSAIENLGAVSHRVLWLPQLAHPRSFAALEVPVGHYFVMGDNRDNSPDSRYFGFVDASEIVGRATMVVASFDPQQHYLPRSDRFLIDLR